MTHGIIAYEGLRKADDYKKESLIGVVPVAIGDGPKWAPGQPESSMFSLYSTSVVGIYGAIVDTTNVEGILSLDCNATDFYGNNSFPVYLYYNPFSDTRSVTFSTEKRVDLFDILSKKYLAKDVSTLAKIYIPADNALVVVVLPAGTRLEKNRNKIKANGIVIAFQ